MGLNPLHSQCCWLEAGQGSISKPQRTQSADRTAAKACLFCVQWCFHCFTGNRILSASTDHRVLFNFSALVIHLGTERDVLGSVCSFHNTDQCALESNLLFFMCLFVKQNRGGTEMLVCYWLSLKTIHFSRWSKSGQTSWGWWILLGVVPISSRASDRSIHIEELDPCPLLDLLWAVPMPLLLLLCPCKHG